METEKPKADLLPGTLDMLVLKILMRGHLHGYAMPKLIQQLSDDLLRVEEGSLYPALQRLELNGWIEGERARRPTTGGLVSTSSPRDGRKHLTEESARYGRSRGGSPHHGVCLIQIGRGVCKPVQFGNVFEGVYGIGWTAAKANRCCRRRWNSILRQ